MYAYSGDQSSRVLLGRILFNENEYLNFGEIQHALENGKCAHASVRVHQSIQGPTYVSGQAVPILHGQDVFSKTFLSKLVATFPSYKKYITKFHHRFIVQNLEFQIYIEKMLERPKSLFMHKRLYSTGLHIAFKTKCPK